MPVENGVENGGSKHDEKTKFLRWYLLREGLNRDAAGAGRLQKFLGRGGRRGHDLKPVYTGRYKNVRGYINQDRTESHNVSYVQPSMRLGLVKICHGIDPILDGRMV